MSKFRVRRPSPALIISILALCVALGGTAIAGTTFKIGTKNLKKNAVTASKIKRNAVTTAKIKKGAVTGTKINESSLGPVPNALSAAKASNADHAANADHAGSADNATNAVNAENAANFSRYYTSGLKKTSVGQNVTLGSIGPFTITGKCEDLGGGSYSAEVVLTTSQAKSFLDSYNSEYSEGDLEPGEEAEIDYGVSDTGPYWYGSSDDYESGWAAASPDGSLLLHGWADSGVHVFGADCAFDLSWMTGS